MNIIKVAEDFKSALEQAGYIGKMTLGTTVCGENYEVNAMLFSKENMRIDFVIRKKNKLVEDKAEQFTVLKHTVERGIINDLIKRIEEK